MMQVQKIVVSTPFFPLPAMNVICVFYERKLKSMAGVQNSTLRSHLSEFMYRHRNGGAGTQIFDALIRDIAARYPVH